MGPPSHRTADSTFPALGYRVSPTVTHIVATLSVLIFLLNVGALIGRVFTPRFPLDIGRTANGTPVIVAVHEQLGGGAERFDGVPVEDFFLTISLMRVGGPGSSVALEVERDSIAVRVGPARESPLAGSSPGRWAVRALRGE